MYEPHGVIVGGGRNGVDLAGMLAEITRHTLRGEFRRCEPSQARVAGRSWSARTTESL